MAVQSEGSRVQYVGNASTAVAYVVPFYFFKDDDLVVVVTDSGGNDALLTRGSDYTVTGAGDEEGGGVVTLLAVPPTSTVTIYREIAATQPTEYESNDAFPAESHERALDRLTMLVQQALRQTGGAVRFTETGGGQDALARRPFSVMGTDGEGGMVLRTVEEMRSFLSLEGGTVTENPTATWADDDERGVKAPDFVGQLGVQLDSGEIFRATGLSDGEWASVSQEVPLGSITAEHLDEDAVTTGAILDEAVTADKLGADVVTSGKIANGAVTLEKLGADVPHCWRSGVEGLRLVPTDSDVAVDIRFSELVVKSAYGGSGRLVLRGTTCKASLAASGAGGVAADTSRSANTWYAIWVIAQEDGTNTGLISPVSSLVPASPGDTPLPTLPAGYVYAAPVSILRTDGTSPNAKWRGFWQSGREVWIPPQELYDESEDALEEGGRMGGTSAAYGLLSGTSLTYFQAAVPTVGPGCTAVSGYFGYQEGDDNAGQTMRVAGSTAGVGACLAHTRTTGTGVDAANLLTPFRIPLPLGNNMAWSGTGDGDDYYYRIVITGYEL